MPDEFNGMGQDEARDFARQAAGEEQTQPPSARERVIAAVSDLGPRFWRDGRGEAYATLTVAGRTERHRVQSSAFRNIAVLAYGDANPVACRGGGSRPGAPPTQPLAEALQALGALALRGGVRQPRPRVWQDDDGSVWLDLGREDWSLVHVTGGGWRVVGGADVPLVRPPGLQPLPMPERDPEALRKLGRLLNFRRSRDLLLACAFLVKALHPDGPNPVLALDGEHGSAKSTATRMLRRLVDPNLADLRPAPGCERDLFAAASNARLLAFDNVSSLTPEMCDALCRVATGCGRSERLLYTNGEEHIVWVCNPVLLNGIPNLLARADLADRALAVTLPAIADEARLTEREVWEAFERASPGILALLLDALALSLRNRPGLRLPRRPRMADFAEVACAAAPAFGTTAERMLAALEANGAETVEAVLDADPFADAVRRFAEERGRWEGSATDLLQELNKLAAHEERSGKDWPKGAARLSNRLRRAVPVLRRACVDVRQGRWRGGSWVAVRSTR